MNNLPIVNNGLSQSDLNSLLNQLKKDDHSVDYRLLEKSIQDFVVANLTTGQILYSINHRTQEINQTLFNGFFKWQINGQNKITAIVDDIAKADPYLLRNIMMNDTSPEKVFLDLKYAQKALKKFIEKQIEDLNKKIKK